MTGWPNYVRMMESRNMIAGLYDLEETIGESGEGQGPTHPRIVSPQAGKI